MARKVAPCDVNVLITGETGTGKSILGARPASPQPPQWRPVCGLFLRQSAGAPGGGRTLWPRKGRLYGGADACAAAGLRPPTAEPCSWMRLGDLPLGLQAKLLRVLNDRTFERLGSNTPLTVDVRLVCATHRNLGRDGQERANSARTFTTA